MLSFQRLEVYQHSIDHFAVLSRIASQLPKGHRTLVDQVRRAALSVPLNIAEGAGRGSPADCARHYVIARGSAMETVAVTDALHSVELIDAATREQILRRAARIVAMLTKLIGSVQATDPVGRPSTSV